MRPSSRPGSRRRRPRPEPRGGRVVRAPRGCWSRDCSGSRRSADRRPLHRVATVRSAQSRDRPGFPSCPAPVGRARDCPVHATAMPLARSGRRGRTARRDSNPWPTRIRPAAHAFPERAGCCSGFVSISITTPQRASRHCPGWVRRAQRRSAAPGSSVRLARSTTCAASPDSVFGFVRPSRAASKSHRLPVAEVAGSRFTSANPTLGCFSK